MGPGGGGGGGGMADLFDILGGGGGRRGPRGPRRGEDVVHRLRVSMEELYNGNVRCGLEHSSLTRDASDASEQPAAVVLGACTGCYAAITA